MTYCLALKSCIENELLIVPAVRITRDFAIYETVHDESQRYYAGNDVWMVVWLVENIRFRHFICRFDAVSYCQLAQQYVDALKNEEDRKNKYRVWEAVVGIEI